MAQRLPTWVTSFIGREEEKKHLSDLIADARILTLTGAGGCGKTRLAVELATDLGDRFDEGVHYVDLAPITEPSLVAREVAAALSINEAPGRDVTELVVAMLGDRNVLLVWDNCEHLIGTCAELASTLLAECPGITLLTTSREPLGIDGEFVFRVPSLPVPTTSSETPEDVSQHDAVRLFMDRATRVRPDLTMSNHDLLAISEICRRLDGIPLAIELAAARTRILSPSQVAQAVEERFHLLTGGTRGALPRQRTLEASVEWSYALLNDLEKLLFARLSVFPGSFDLPAVEEICSADGIDRDDILDLLTGLVDKSLVQTEDIGSETRYRMLETIRHYARQKLADTRAASLLRDRHLDHYLALAERSEPALERHGWATGLDRLETELDNLRAAMDWALASGQVEKNLRIVGATWSFWFVRARYGEMQETLERGLNAGETDPLVRTKALLAAVAVWFTTDFHTVRRLAIEAEELARSGGDEGLLARALCWVGWTEFWLGLGDGRSRIREALDLERRAGDSLNLVRCLIFLGAIDAMSGEMPSGRDHLEEAIAVARRTGYDPGLGHALTFLGVLEWYAGNLPLAEETLEASLRVGRKLRDATFTALPLGMLGTVGALRGDLDGAEGKAREAITIGAGSGARTAQAFGGWSLVLLHVIRGKPEATTSLDLVLEGFRVSGMRILIGQTLWVAGVASLQAEDHDTARARFDEMIAEAGGAPWIRTRALAGLATLARIEDDPGRAEDLAHEALQVAAGAEDRVGIVDLLELLGALAADQESHLEAVRLLATADALRRAIDYVRFPIDEPEHDKRLRVIRGALDEDAFDGAWSEGAALSMNDAISYAARGRGERKRPSVGWDSLTPTEVEVVRLVAAGLTNPQIAERLFVSRNTVKAHLSHVFTKLDISNRAELAVVAARHGLVDETTEAPA